MQENSLKYHRKKEEIVLYELEELIEDGEETFAKYIRKKRKEKISPSTKKALSIKEHADMLGLSQEMYRKILNMQKRTKSRDCIIAICATLELDPEDTNRALHLYGSLPGLDEDSPRDKVIINVLNASFDELSIETINKHLLQQGLDPLEIIDHRYKMNKDATPQSLICPYKILKKTVKTTKDTLVYGDKYSSLSTAFDISRYHCYANMWLDDPQNNLVYKLTADSDGSLISEKIPRPEKPESWFVQYETLKDTDIFSSYFVELQDMAKKEKKRMEWILNDTKNYRERIGAGISNGRIHVFYETYNYALPEFNEYYFFEYIEGVFRLTVSKHSLFMKNYLSREEYEIHFGRSNNGQLCHYDSAEEIEKLIASRNNAESEIYRLRKAAYNELKSRVEECLTKIRNREVFVRNLSEIWDDQDRVCKFYGVEEKYQCELIGDYMIARKTEAVFSLDEKTTETITLEDLYRAFELGFNSIQEICSAKNQNGSIEASLK